MIHRRLLASTALVSVAAVGLAACSPAGTPVATQLTNALTIAQTIDQALVKITNDVANAPISLITAVQQSTVLAGLATAATGISAFLANAAPPAGASTLAQINAWFTIALNTAAPVLAVVLPAATPIILALEAVDALLPVFEAQILTPVAIPSVAMMTGRARVHAARVARGMTPDTALTTLHGYLGK